MGSLNHSDIPVVSKESKTYRNINGRKIIHTESTNDGSAVEVSSPPDRELGSNDQKAWGVVREARTTTERVASDVDASRSQIVDKTGPEDLLEVIPTGQPSNVQVSIRHTGNRVVEGSSINHEVADRTSND